MDSEEAGLTEAGDGTTASEGEEEEVEDRCVAVVHFESRVPDGGWGWMVALGTFIIHLFSFSLPFCFGILFSGFLLENGASSTTIAWIYNLFLVVWNLSMILANPLSQEFGQRTVGFASVFMASLSLILSGFSPSVSFLYFSYSLLGGMCTGVSQGIACMVLPPYFHKKGGQANTILVAGAPVTQMVLAPFIRYLLEVYSLKGAALIHAAVVLNGLIAVSFFHPVQWHLKPLMSAGSDVSCRIPCLSDEIEESTTREKSRGVKAIWKTLWRVAGRIRSDLKVLRQLRCVILAVTVMITQTTFLNFIMMLPFVAQATDHSLQDAAGCIALMGVTNLVTRLVVSPLSDCKRFSIRFSIMLGYLLRAIGNLGKVPTDNWPSSTLSILQHCLTGRHGETARELKVIFLFSVASLASELWQFMASGVVCGLGLGLSLGVYNLAIVQYMGMDNLRPTIGITGLVAAGVIRDSTNSYLTSLCVMAALDLLSVCLWLLMPAAQARDTRTELRPKISYDATRP
ncbi:Monocarboxylate transporter 2 [Chionoecetes opilio]|uniref:Monocarboxylate transporter 2 n=1 Tax=Chionoecetes opilio TaxID=41210 RepID=A0A8J4Y5M4_CHIOP|nr:Monocarboxylate transporter 2 [Chionoecetes opilio]